MKHLTASDAVQELCFLLQSSYDLAERVCALQQSYPAESLKAVYTEVESLSVSIDQAIKGALYGSN